MTKKEVHTIIIKEVICEYKLVWLSTLIALLLSLWTIIPSLYIKTIIPHEYNLAVNTIIQSISLSYIAGSLFFVLSVILPSIHSRYSILPSVSDKLISLKGAYFSFMVVSESFQEYSSDFNLKSFVERTVQEDCKQYCDEERWSVEEFDYDVHFKPESVFSLSFSLQWLDEALFEIQAMASWLSPEDQRVLSKIKHDNFVYLIRGICGSRFKTSYEIDDVTIRFGILKAFLLDYKHSREQLEEFVKKYEKYHIDKR